MPLYEKKESIINESKYCVEISRDPLFSRRREVDVYNNQIGGLRIILEGTVHFLSEEGERVGGSMAMPYPFSLKCEKNGDPYVNEITGLLEEYPKDEEGLILEGITTRYNFIMNILPFDNSKTYIKRMDVVTEMELMFIKNADLNNEFNL